MRRVEILNDQRQPIRTGWFHDWGMASEEFETGPGNYSVALVEVDGLIEVTIPERIRFVDPPPEETR